MNENQTVSLEKTIKNHHSSAKNLICDLNNNINNEPDQQKIILHLSDGKELLLSKNIILSLNPSLIPQNNITNEKIILFLPENINQDEILKYIYIFNSQDFLGPEFIGNNREELMAILTLNDFFGNENLNIKILSKIILPSLNQNSAIDILIYSYNKLCYYSQKQTQANNIYFDLFYQSIEEICKNVKLVLYSTERLKSLDKKIIEELIQKIFCNLIYSNCKLIPENDSLIKNEKDIADNYFNDEEIDKKNSFSNIFIQENDSNLRNLNVLKLSEIKKLINFLMQTYKLSNFFDLLVTEYMTLLSSESINEIQKIPHPLFQVNIPFSSYKNYYDEVTLEINLNNKKLILVIFYKYSDKSFNVCIKLSSSQNNKERTCNDIINIEKISNEAEEKYFFNIFTFLTYAIITKGPEKIPIGNENNLISLSNNKSMYTILKINNFDNEISNFLIRNPDKEYFSVIVQIKICYLYSALASYLLKDFPLYINDPNINKISKQLLILLLKNKYLNKKEDNDIVKVILLWLNDEINIKEDISEIFNVIKWENIDDSLIFELIIKYSHIILGNDSLENLFINTFQKKYNDSVIIVSIIKNIFTAAEAIDYNKIYSQMKKSEKYCKAYKCFNSVSKFSGNNFINNDYCLSGSKDSLSMRNFLMNYSSNVNLYLNTNIDKGIDFGKEEEDLKVNGKNMQKKDEIKIDNNANTKENEEINKINDIKENDDDKKVKEEEGEKEKKKEREKRVNNKKINKAENKKMKRNIEINNLINSMINKKNLTNDLLLRENNTSTNFFNNKNFIYLNKNTNTNTNCNTIKNIVTENNNQKKDKNYNKINIKPGKYTINKEINKETKSPFKKKYDKIQKNRNLSNKIMYNNTNINSINNENKKDNSFLLDNIAKKYNLKINTNENKSKNTHVKSKSNINYEHRKNNSSLGGIHITNIKKNIINTNVLFVKTPNKDNNNVSNSNVKVNMKTNITENSNKEINKKIKEMKMIHRPKSNLKKINSFLYNNRNYKNISENKLNKSINLANKK